MKTVFFLSCVRFTESCLRRKFHLAHEKSVRLMTVCSCHVTYVFQSESTLYSCLNVKELLARSRREI